MKCRHVPGMSISVLHKDKEIITKGFGYSDVSSNTTVSENTTFVLGSISKMFTATLIGILLGRNPKRHGIFLLVNIFCIIYINKTKTLSY